MVERRALLVDRPRLGPRPDEPVEVARLELVRVLRQRAEVGDAVVRRTGGEGVARRQRLQGRVAARTAATDDRPGAVDPPGGRQVLDAGDAVLDVGDPPHAAQGVAELAPVAG